MKILVVGGAPDGEEVDSELQRACNEIGRDLADSGHDLVICSPFPDSADSHVAEAYLNEAGRSVKMHLPGEPDILKQAQTLKRLGAKIVLGPARSQAALADTAALAHVWAYAQTRALGECDAVVAIGGRVGGAGRVALDGATAMRRERAVLPFAAFGGAAEDFFDAHYDLLRTRLGARFPDLQTRTGPSECASLLDEMTTQTLPGNPRFFLSYAHRTNNIYRGDTVANILQDQIVWRDLKDLRVGQHVDGEIRRNIDRADVFVALWSYEYAASPDCIDELEMALDRRENGMLPRIWILRIDEARISNSRLRGLLGPSGSEPAVMEKRSEIEAFLRRGIRELSKRVD